MAIFWTGYFLLHSIVFKIRKEPCTTINTKPCTWQDGRIGGKNKWTKNKVNNNNNNNNNNTWRSPSVNNSKKGVKTHEPKATTTTLGGHLHRWMCSFSSHLNRIFSIHFWCDASTHTFWCKFCLGWNRHWMMEPHPVSVIQNVRGSRFTQPVEESTSPWRKLGQQVHFSSFSKEQRLIHQQWNTELANFQNKQHRSHQLVNETTSNSPTCQRNNADLAKFSKEQRWSCQVFNGTTLILPTFQRNNADLANFIMEQR